MNIFRSLLKVFGSNMPLKFDIVETPYGKWLLFDGPDQISNQIRRDGGFSIFEINVCQFFLNNKQNAAVIDVGANLGSFTIPIASYAQELGISVHAFEPQRLVFQQLCANIILNALDNVFTYNVALGDANEMIKIPELNTSTSENIGAFSLNEKIRKNLDLEYQRGNAFCKNYETARTQEFWVQKQQLDDFEIQQDIAFVKVDVEGMELEFFQGCGNTLQAHNYPPIVFELWDRFFWYDQKAANIVNLVQDMGYILQKYGRSIIAQHPKHQEIYNFNLKTSTIPNQNTMSPE